MTEGKGSPAGGGSGLSAKVGKDLGPRVATGLAMAVVGATAIWLGGWPFALLVLATCLAIAWEWGRLVRGQEADVILAAHAGTVIAVVVLTALGLVMPAGLAVAMGALLVAVLAFGQRLRLSTLGVLYAALPAIALIWLRSDPTWGLLAVLLLVVIVVATDVGAYFAGRLIGGPKLAPRLSPNKTWAGLLGGMVTAGVVAALYASQIKGADPMRLAVIGAILAVLAQAGDLGESALKRAFGAKDASSLLGPHGGVMDRVDGLVTAAAALGIWAAWVNIRAPARAILFGS
jgi:phosphatidate cytidylyltransferase